MCWKARSWDETSTLRMDCFSFLKCSNMFQRAGKPTAEASKLNEEVHEIQTQPDSRRPRMLLGAGHRKIPSFPNHCLNAF